MAKATPKFESNVDADEAVLRMLQEEHPDAARRLVDVYGERIYGLSLRILESEADAREAVQETFLTVWRKWRSFKGKSKFSSWIYRVAANNAYMKLRRRRRRRDDLSLDQPVHGSDSDLLLGDSVPASGLGPAELLERDETRALVNRAIESLSPTYRTAYMLKDVEGMSLKDIAEALELSEAAVKSRVHRARLIIRDRLLRQFNS